MSIKLLSIFSWISLVASDVTVDYGCRFEVGQEIGFEILSENKSVNFVKDHVTQKIYAEIKPGKIFTISCDVANRISTKSAVAIQCINGQYIKASGSDELLQLDKLGCRTARELAYKEKVYRKGKCYNNYTNIEIELSNGESSYTLISVCHNEEISETLFAKNVIRGEDLHNSETVRRPGFKEGGFYPDISVNDCYTQLGQVDTLTQLLGSEDLVEEYIDRKQYLTRGHLTPNADGIQGYEKRATFYFVNVVGQWQTINSGNWNRLEAMTRRIAEQRQTNLTIYTGGYGVTKLTDVNGNEVEIWLGKDRYGELVKKVPVPHLVWKVIHDEGKKEGVVMISVNNPYTDITNTDILCGDICDKLKWINWNTEDQRLGYMYCCTVSSFAKAVPYAPKLGNLKLLNESIEEDEV